MLNGSELATAIAAVLIGAVCTGFLLHWSWARLGRSPDGGDAQINEMAERLHDADLAREAAELAEQQAEALLAQREADTAERLAAMQAHLDGVIEGREAELKYELDVARRELGIMRDGLGKARQRNIELEAEIGNLRSGSS